MVSVTDLVEKPVPGSAPSNWILIGRYVCDPAIFDVLRETQPGRGGEIQLTDALMTLAGQSPAEGGGVHGVLFHGRRYDTGNKLDYLRTLVQFACERSDLAEEMRALATQVPGQPGVTTVADDLISVEAHLADILATIRPLTPTELSLSDAHGLVLAEDVAASQSAAVLRQLGHGRLRGTGRRPRRRDRRIHPVTLPVVAEVAAGDTGAYSLPEGTASGS